MKKARIDPGTTNTHQPSQVVAPQDAELEEDSDGVDVVEVDVKVEADIEDEANVKTERERWSVVWKFFERLPIGKDGRERAKCKRCSKRYICETRNGTGSLRTHIRKCPRKDQKDISQLIFSKSGGLKNAVFKPERFRELVSEAIVKHNLPFKFVEYEGIREIFSYLNENVTTHSRNTAREDVMNLYKREKTKLKKLLEIIPGRVSLTSDLWSSINTDGFLCVTCHFIDKEWILQKRILNFQYMPPPHNGISLAETISTLLSDWGIDKKLFTITLDNASSNDTFVNLLKGQLCNDGALRSNGDYFHIRCCAHVLNLIVQDGMKAIDEAIVKVRESVKYVKGSQEFTAYESKEFASSQKSQLEMYLDEPRSDIDEDLDVLYFWTNHQYRYPELASMARDILSIPVSTVASESAFSNGGRVLDQYRSSLKHGIVEAIICAKDWMFGVKGDEELSLQELTDDIMKDDGTETHEKMEA